MFVSFATGLISCKKEVSPDLEIVVVDTNGVVVPSAWVKTSVDGAVFGILNNTVLDSGRTNQSGSIIFEYDNTIVIDVAVYNAGVPVDSTSVLLETKRLKKSEDNIYTKRLVYK